MKLVVDTNRIIAALIKDSASRKVLLSDDINFLTIGLAREEIDEHAAEILKKSNVTRQQLDVLLSLLFSKISVVSDNLVKTKMNEAKKIMDAVDKSDTPFIALALAVENDGIWSEDKHFEKQRKIKIWKTGELLEFADS